MGGPMHRQSTAAQILRLHGGNPFDNQAMMNDLFSDATSSARLYAGRYPIRAHPCGRGWIIEVPDGELFYAPDFFAPHIASRAQQVLLANDRYPASGTDWVSASLADIGWQTIAWHQSTMMMFGKRVSLPRYCAWHGDNDKPYTYSGITLHPQPWNKVLIWLRDQLQAVTDIRFNSVLLNWYRSGDDHISWHADDERELGHNPVIASVSFGATRRFLLRRNDDHSQKIELPLAHGSLLVMRGALQHYWQHAVPQERKVKSSRINLTFRVIDPS